jgi:hypothetical protein
MQVFFHLSICRAMRTRLRENEADMRLLLLLTASVFAQDLRTVVEPHIPDANCAVLEARQSTTPNEDAPDTTRV